jgi:nucleotide-binding universal stress UspA family protein
MLLLTEPSTHPKGFSHLVVEGTDHPKTENTIAVAVDLARAFEAGNLTIIQESDPSKLALIRSEELKENEADERKEQILKEEDEKLEEILRCTDCGGLRITTKRIEGKPGYVISNYARLKNADLLVVNSPDKPMNLLDRVFPHDIEHALADLPCNLLIVHPKNIE